MLIFSHRGIGFGARDNSSEALSKAAKQGFSLEVDLRLEDNAVILSHDASDTGEYEHFSVLLKLMQDYPAVYFALHLKENSEALFRDAGNQLKPFKNFFLFATDFRQDGFIREAYDLVGKERLALYVYNKVIDPGLIEKVDYLWMDETGGSIYKDLEHFNILGKKIVCCSPELYTHKYKSRVEYLKHKISESAVFGICTDWPDYYAKI